MIEIPLIFNDTRAYIHKPYVLSNNNHGNVERNQKMETTSHEYKKHLNLATRLQAHTFTLQLFLVVMVSSSQLAEVA